MTVYAAAGYRARRQRPRRRTRAPSPARRDAGTSMGIVDKRGVEHRLPQASDFVTPRGGGYFFAPSLAAPAAFAMGAATTSV